MTKPVYLSALLALISVGSAWAGGPGVPDLAWLLNGAQREQQVEWAVRYEHGEGVTQDYDRAIRLFCEAARRGSAAAQYELGWIYANGRGLARNDRLAAAWFRLAVAQGDTLAARTLARVDDPENVEPARCVRPNGQEDFPLPSGSSPETRRRVAGMVRQLAPDYELDPALVLALIQVESNFNPGARSPKDAQGLMQLIPATAERFGVQDVMHPLQNLKGGMAYLRWLVNHFQGNLELALAGYNAGEAAVKRYGGIPPYAETRRYVKTVMRLYRRSLPVTATSANSPRLGQS